MMMHIRHTLYLLTLTAFVLSCSSNKEKKAEKEVKKEAVKKDVAIVTFSPEKGLLSSSLQLPGELIAFQQVDIYAKVSSFVKSLKVDVGSVVKQGQLLAVMEAPEINSQL